MPTRPRLPHRVVPAVIAALALTVLVAATIATAADRSVRIEDFAFAPRTLTISVGDRVTWTNRDAIEHTATARSGAFDTGLLGDGESRTVRFTKAGTYRYLCTPHPTMTGTIVVRAAGGAPPDTATLDAPETSHQGVSWPGLAALIVLLGWSVLAGVRAIVRR
jgi:plastocyanin